MEIIDGRKIANEILNHLKTQVLQLTFRPLFCDVLVGADPVSESYVKIKGRAAKSIGLDFKVFKFSETILENDLIAEIKKINQLPNICGLIIQLPLPDSLNRDKVLNAIDENLDVDAVGSQNNQLFYENNPKFILPTAAAVMQILENLKINLEKLSFLVIGQGELVGKPVAHLLKYRGYKVLVADKNTENLSQLLKSADVIISATGRANLFGGKNIKPGAIIIDAGSSEQNGSIAGDVDFSSLKNFEGQITPVPGGVGPVTVVMLLNNVLTVALNKNK
jgi:methylenetetrahydrofolate dehydrogenase (NADP+)/methenyltetrahydrofolate cyclohydrolase